MPSPRAKGMVLVILFALQQLSEVVTMKSLMISYSIGKVKALQEADDKNNDE